MSIASIERQWGIDKGGMMPKKLVKPKGLKPGGKCCLCGSKPAFSKNSIYCRDCSHFCARLSNERFSPEVCKSLKDDVRKRGGFYCFYTEQELDVFDYTSPYFLEFDHFVPGDPQQDRHDQRLDQ